MWQTWNLFKRYVLFYYVDQSSDISPQALKDKSIKKNGQRYKKFMRQMDKKEAKGKISVEDVLARAGKPKDAFSRRSRQKACGRPETGCRRRCLTKHLAMAQ